MEPDRAAEIARDRDTEDYHRPKNRYELERDVVDLEIKIDRLEDIIAHLIEDADLIIEAVGELDHAIEERRKGGYKDDTEVMRWTGRLMARAELLGITRRTWGGDY